MTFPATTGKLLRVLAVPMIALTSALLLPGCEDNVPTVGGSLAAGEVHIALDSLVWDGTDHYIYRGDNKFTVNCPKISYTTVYNKKIDSRSTTNLIGRLTVPEYGDLHCSFVSRLMSTVKLNIPDSIPLEQIDSMKLVLTIPRGQLTGDSLAPQQLKVYRLTKSLPLDITNEFNPTGYYNPEEAIGTRSYTLSALGMSDSIYSSAAAVYIEIPVSQEMAQETVKAYRNPATAGIFQWPQTFEEYFHGIYVEPTFGRGCVANITSTDFYLFYNYEKTETKTDSAGNVTVNTKTVTEATGVFGSSPIVLSSNNISYTPSAKLQEMAAANDPIITTPGGYSVKMTFPGKELVDIYHNTQSKLAVVSDLTFTIPVEEIENEYDIAPPPYMLMVKTSKLEEFWANNSLPDSKESFYSAYDSSKKQYVFEGMRQYIIDLIKNGAKEEDLDFTLVPADLTFKKNENTNNSWYNPYYGSSGNTTTYYMTKCAPYIAKPTMCRLKLDEAQTIFTYSLQQMQ